MMYMGVDMTIKMATVGTNINDVSLTNLPCHEKTNLINYLIAHYFLNSYLRVKVYFHFLLKLNDYLMIHTPDM